MVNGKVFSKAFGVAIRLKAVNQDNRREIDQHFLPTDQRLMLKFIADYEKEHGKIDLDEIQK